MLLADALVQNGFSVERQQPVPIHFRGKASMRVSERILSGGDRPCRVEICRISRSGSPKAVAHVPLSGLKLGFLINFSGGAVQGKHRANCEWALMNLESDPGPRLLTIPCHIPWRSQRPLREPSPITDNR